MKERVLITGFGFIGRHVAKALVQQGHNVTVLDRKPDVEAITQQGLSPIIGDIRDTELMHDLIPHYDGVINLAGLLGTSEMINDPIPAINTNIIGAINIFEGCRRAKITGRMVRCVQITVGNHFMDNPYSITKSTVERFANMYNIEHGTDIRVIRVLNAYGEYQKYFPVRKIVPNFIRAALKNEPLRIYGDGKQIMDMIYVEDVARILNQSLFFEKFNGIISAGTGRQLNVNEIAKMIIKEVGSSSKLDHVAMRPGEPEHSVVLGEPETLLKININPKSLIEFEEGISKTICWYRNNKEFTDL